MLRRIVLAVAVVALITQVISATRRTRFETPNASTQIAMNLDRHGIYGIEVGEGGWWRAFQLPGEPLYLFAGFRALPASLRPYLHLPVVLLWVAGIAIVATTLSGARAGLIAGLLAALGPFTLIHGPVWDDAWLAAGLDWAVFAIAVVSAARLASDGRPPAFGSLLLVAICAGYASVTRSQSLILLAPAAIALISSRRFRGLRALGWGMTAGIVIAAGAWTLRNWLVLGAIVLGSTHDGQTLWHSNNPATRRALIETGVVQTYADMSIPPGRGEVEADRVFRRAAIDYVRSSPLDAIRTAGVKIGVSLAGLDLRRPLTALRNTAAAGASIALMIAGIRGLKKLNATDAPAWALFRTLGVISLVVTLVMLALGPAGLRYWLTLSGVLHVGAGSFLGRLWMPRAAQQPGFAGASE